MKAMSYKPRAFLGLSAALLLSANVLADDTANQEKPAFSVSQSVQMTATVEAINMETRQVTLKGEDGESHTITAPEEAHNLDQVQPGDVVVAEFVRELDIEVFADDGSELGAGAIEAAGRAEKGAQPGGMAIASEVVTARVAEINLEANTFKLQWPDDSVEEYVIQNPENAKHAAVGDIVVITYTEAIGIVVRKPEGE
jgi:hypothetical protein